MYTKTVFIVKWNDLACLNCCYRNVKISGKYIPATHTWVAWVTGPHTCAPYMSRASVFINQRPKYEPISVEIILDRSSAGLYLAPYFYCLSLQGCMVYKNGKLNLCFGIFVLLVGIKTCFFNFILVNINDSIFLSGLRLVFWAILPSRSICLHQLKYCKFIYFLTD